MPSIDVMAVHYTTKQAAPGHERLTFSEFRPPEARSLAGCDAGFVQVERVWNESATNR